MNFVNRRRNSGHLCQRWDPGALHHRTAERVDAQLLRRGEQPLTLKAVFDRRDRRKLAVTFVATA
jgi:hypothetical protein